MILILSNNGLWFCLSIYIFVCIFSFIPKDATVPYCYYFVTCMFSTYLTPVCVFLYTQITVICWTTIVLEFKVVKILFQYFIFISTFCFVTIVTPSTKDMKMFWIFFKMFYKVFCIFLLLNCLEMILCMV